MRSWPVIGLSVISMVFLRLIGFKAYSSDYQGDPKTVRLSHWIVKYTSIEQNQILNRATRMPSMTRHIRMDSLSRSAKSIIVVCFQLDICNLLEVKPLEAVHKEHRLTGLRTGDKLQFAD